MTMVVLRAGDHAFFINGRRIDAGASFEADLTLAHDLVANRRAMPTDAVSADLIRKHSERERDAMLARLDREARIARLSRSG